MSTITNPAHAGQREQHPPPRPEELVLPIGPPGGTGPPGPEGERGPIGPQGLLGPEGPRGISGTLGPMGPEGPRGPEGQQGPSGTGAPGDQGPIGPVGPQGEVGPQGDEGPQGIQGSQGDQGLVGPAGIQGSTGATGPKGDKGDTGNTGATGAAGPDNIVVGKTIPALGAAQNGFGWTYDHATGAMVWRDMATQAELDTVAAAKLDKAVTACVLRKSADQVFTTAVDANLTWNVEVEDPAGWHDNVTANDRITVDATAWYRVSASVSWTASSTGGRVLRLLRNGTEMLAAMRNQAKLEGDVPLYWEGRLTAADFLIIVAMQDSGSNKSALAAPPPNAFQRTEFRVVKAGT